MLNDAKIEEFAKEDLQPQKVYVDTKVIMAPQ